MKSINRPGDCMHATRCCPARFILITTVWINDMPRSVHRRVSNKAISRSIFGFPCRAIPCLRCRASRCRRRVRVYGKEKNSRPDSSPPAMGNAVVRLPNALKRTPQAYKQSFNHIPTATLHRRACSSSARILKPAVASFEDGHLVIIEQNLPQPQPHVRPPIIRAIERIRVRVVLV